MFIDISDEEMNAIFDEWRDHRYFDRVLLSVVAVVGLTLATPQGLKIIFAPILFPFYLWGILPID